MKMWEFLLWLKNKSLFNFKKPVDMFDIAGAPGMFVIATDNFIKKYYPNSSLNWYSCSLEGGTALTDSYGLYKNNLDRYKSCDVSNETDLKDCLNWVNRKFNLVTGDIGIFHEDVYEKLQEEDQLNIQWGQMVLALNLCENGGVLFLKMYSLVTKETVYLLDTLTGYFENVYIVKPYASRVLNTESYIICINKNKKDVSNVPFVRPYIKNYTSDNIDLIKSFEYSRLDIKFRMNNLINHLLSSQPNLRMEEAKENAIYKVYFEEFKDIYDTITQITKDDNQQKETSKEKPNKAIEQKKQKKQNTDIIIKNKTLLLTD